MYFSDVCVFNVPTLTKNDIGRFTTVFSARPPVPCHLDCEGSRATDTEAESALVKGLLYVDYDATLTPDMTVTVAGSVYEISDIQHALKHHTEVSVRRRAS